MSKQLELNVVATRTPAEDTIPEAWASLLSPEVQSLADRLLGTVAKERQTAAIYPPQGMLFAALTLTPPQKTRVVILGQDPYHGAGQAHGLAFSVPQGIRPPPSLRNIFKELSADLEAPQTTTSTDLTDWARQGVLLLNTSLTVRDGEAGSHAGLGWQELTAAIVAAIAKHHAPIVFILWGNHAQQRRNLIDPSRHLVIASAHPSPLSARRGFFGSRPFSRTNAYLIEHGQPPIDW